MSTVKIFKVLIFLNIDIDLRVEQSGPVTGKTNWKHTEESPKPLITYDAHRYLHSVNLHWNSSRSEEGGKRSSGVPRNFVRGEGVWFNKLS